MNYKDKYIKYKIKYYNLKTKINNNKIIYKGNIKIINNGKILISNSSFIFCEFIYKNINGFIISFNYNKSCIDFYEKYFDKIINKIPTNKLDYIIFCFEEPTITNNIKQVITNILHKIKNKFKININIVLSDDISSCYYNDKSRIYLIHNNNVNDNIIPKKIKPIYFDNNLEFKDSKSSVGLKINDICFISCNLPNKNLRKNALDKLFIQQENNDNVIIVGDIDY